MLVLKPTAGKMSFIVRALFYPTLGYNVLMSKCTSRAYYNQVDDNVLIGALPLRSVAKKLVDQENIKAVLSMTESHELKLTPTKEEWAAMGVDQLQLNTMDLIATPSSDKLHRGVDFIMSHRDQGHKVYVHCKAGRTRSATVTICYLMTVNQWNPETAYDYLKKCRPQIWLREKQLESVNSFYKDLS